MKLRYRILSVTGALLALVVASLAIAISYDSSCTAPDALPDGVPRMKAIAYRCYGGPEVLKLEEVAQPTLADNQVLVRVRAAAINPLDWHYMRGEPYVMRLSSGIGAPSDTNFGVDFAGVVETVGASVTQFKPGDEVFGAAGGALAQYVAVRETRIALKPANISFEQAAAAPIAAITALQGLRDQGGLQPGQKVLINGASGGVGTFAVQIAKSMGAEVTGVSSTRNVELVRSLGATQVIDYKQENFTHGEERYDLILDTIGNQPLSAIRRVLKDDGTLVIIGAPSDGAWLGPLKHMLLTLMQAPFGDEKVVSFTARIDKPDLELLREQMQSGKVTPVIDRRYTLNEVPAAIEYLETGRARGKVVVVVE